MLFRATSLKFIADEYSTQIGLKGIYDYLQDVTAGTGLHMIPGTQGLVGWIDESWKRGNVAQKAVTQVHAGRHDLGPANINLITALNYMGYNFSSSKSRKINDVAKSLTTDAGTVNLTINFVLDAMVDLKGHFCCGYSRRNTELLVSWLREGKNIFGIEQAVRQDEI